MADAKIPDITGLATLASDDEIYVVDKSDTTDSADGTSKKFSVGISSPLVGTTDTQTLTNKTLTSPVITGATLTTSTLTTPVVASFYQDAARTKLMTVPNVASDTLVTLVASQTLTTKTLTAPTLTSPVINTAISGTAVLDGDNMASDSATKVATQQSIKAYVDSVHDMTITFTNKTYVQKVTSYAPVGAGTTTIDLTTGNIHTVTMPATTQTLAISNEAIGQCFMIEINNVTDQGALTWFTTIRWDNGTAPTLTGTNGKRDVFGFRVTGASTYDGFIVGQNL